MILIDGYRVTDVRLGCVPVERVICSGQVVWERAKYLYVESEQLWMPQWESVADMAVYSNTEWRAEVGDVEESLYLYVDREQTDIAHGGGTVDVHVISNTGWRAESGDGELMTLRVMPNVAEIPQQANQEAELTVNYPAEWEVRNIKNEYSD